MEFTCNQARKMRNRERLSPAVPKRRESSNSKSRERRMSDTGVVPSDNKPVTMRREVIKSGRAKSGIIDGPISRRRGVRDHTSCNLEIPSTERRRSRDSSLIRDTANFLRRSYQKGKHLMENLKNQDDGLSSHHKYHMWDEDKENGFRIRQILITPPAADSHYLLSKSQVCSRSKDKNQNKLMENILSILQQVEIRVPKASDELQREKWFGAMRTLMKGTFSGYELFRNAVEYLPHGTRFNEISQEFTTRTIRHKRFAWNQVEEFQSHVQDTIFHDLSFEGTFTMQKCDKLYEYEVKWNVEGPLNEQNLREKSKIRVIDNNKGTEYIDLATDKVLTHGIHKI
ncbi:hypothetical protein Ciccas_010822, partial [Cichlidogyrus casuarinus]